MKRNTALTCLVSLLTLGLGAGRAQTPVATPSFTISASNITMPSNGTGSIPFTLTSVNGFVGTVHVTCVSPNPPVGVREPYCDNPAPAVASAYVLTANATATGSSVILASAPLPTTVMLNLPKHGERAPWALAGALMLGFGIKRRKSRRSTRLLPVLGMLIGLTGIGISGCGSPKTLTPGIYAYTLNASYVQNNTSLSASTTVNVTVPPGIVVQ